MRMINTVTVLLYKTQLLIYICLVRECAQNSELISLMLIF